MLFFYKTTSLDLLVLKALFPDKQRKLSHLIAVFGHQYLLKAMLMQVEETLTAKADRIKDNLPTVRSHNQIKHQFLNAVDRDFSTPLILALRN